MEMSEFFEDFMKSYSELMDNYIEIMFKIKDTPEEKANINEIFRVAHSIKGMAASMEYNKLERAVHKIEDILYEVRDEKIEMNDDIIDIIAEGYRILNEFLSQISENGNDNDADEEMVKKLIDRIDLYIVPEEKNTVNPAEIYKMPNELKEKISEIIKTKESNSIVEFEVEAKSSFKCVRAYMAINNVAEVYKIVCTIPDIEIIKNNLCDFENVFIICNEDIDKEETIKRVEAACEIKRVKIHEIKNIDQVEKIIENRTIGAEIEDNAEKENEQPVIIDDDFKNEISLELQELCDTIEKELINLGYDFTNTAIAEEIKDKVREMSEVAEYLKIKNVNSIIEKIDKMLLRKECLFEDDNSEYIDNILDAVILIKKIAAKKDITKNGNEQKIVDQFLEKIEAVIKKPKIKEEKIGELLKKELNLTEEDITKLLELQRDKYPELKLGEIAVIENKATTKDVLEMLRKQKKNVLKNTASDSYEYIKIKAAKADDLLDLIEEVLTIQASLQNKIRKIENGGNIVNEFIKLETIIRGIQGISISFRMVSLKTVFQNLRMTFKETAKKLNKGVKLEIMGEETEVDRLIANRLYEPMLHIVKNAISHGIEEEEERRRNGKEKEGKVKIKAFIEKGHAFIEISDDGSGIIIDKVYKKALEKKLIDERRQYTDEEIINFIFLPGFSTVESVNEISGRGVGMDVVRTELSKMGGKVFIESDAGRGSKFILKVPKNMTALNGTVIETSGQKYVIPTFYIKEIYVPQDGDYISIAGEEKNIRFRNKIVPLMEMSIISDNKKEKKEIVLILENDNMLKAMPVDKIHERRDIVVKSFGNDMEGIDFIFGATVLEDGNPVVILNIENMFKN